ncbi:hypothetical protein [Erythrobacter sp.]|uniref:hypothetical protein n=1 Tax=Erythrobacter sp. TaxID=1042 RepID=UPI0025CCCB83|nr:hypothetical protein [Erythrobacter sp.]
MIHALIAAALTLQAAPAAPAPPVSLEDLTLQQSAALRCAVAFAFVSDWQKAGDARGAAGPLGLDQDGGREFFVRTIAQLMDDRGLDRRGAFDLIALQGERLKASPDDIPAMMPACLLMKSAAGL